MTERQMIMTHTAWIDAPFAQPTTQATPAPEVEVIMGHGDEVMIFRSQLLVREANGVDLRAAFDRLTMIHPQVAMIVAEAGSGGMIMRERAIGSLTEYMITGVAVAPHLPRSL